ncbi:aldehyde dehydrogenase family 2 member C4-like isoform X4 [Arachis ipaensis]|uniref:aldehyde dehydrogenase family 2 member C4-like isoform X4 n=1 Tax=Arachis ipaensis TaxID=130454 RepID=UPI000A2B2777|nr:aldehyde dehydrogenase family 2 member C4-like isoform X4 [Arachis ipaensis]
MVFSHLLLLAAKKFGVNEFVNPKDHNKPIQEVSFTGSTETGRKVMMAATMSNLKSVSLELGGKSPVLIFDDADVDKAVDLALFGTLHNKEH